MLVPHLFRSLCCLTFMSLLGNVNAQAPEATPRSGSEGSRLPVTGRVTDGEKKLEGCTVITFLGNETIATHTTDRSGKFRAELGLGQEYTLEFRREGFMPKRIMVDTRADLPGEELVFVPLEMDVSMLQAEKYEGADTDVLDFPFAIVRFDKKAHAFVQDPQYTSGMMRANGALLLMAGRAGKK